MIDVANYVGGKLVNVDEKIANISPLNGEVIANIPRTKSVTDAVLAAKSALPLWSGLSYGERANWLRKIADKLEKDREEIARLESLDTGKPAEVAMNVDTARSIENFRFFASYETHLDDLVLEMEDATNFVERRPIGVVGLISPWNLPLYLLTWKIAPALMMGNTVVAKPSEMTPLTAFRLSQICIEIGLPEGVLNIVHGLGPEIGQALVEHPEIKAISFTGGTETGRIVARTAAPMFKKLSLELGGKNASIILDDADLDLTIPGVVRAGFLNSGQICLCNSRILIHESLYDEFLPRFLAEVEKLQIGPVISEQHQAKVLSYIDLAKQEGGEILAGGNALEKSGSWIEPTVIGNLSHDSRCSTEEIFGPVVTLHTFSDDAEAITIANGTEYGLAGSIWSEKRGHELASQLDTGMVWVNTWLHRDLRVPFGGVKNSGVGREGGEYSLNFFSELCNICIKD